MSLRPGFGSYIFKTSPYILPSLITPCSLSLRSLSSHFPGLRRVHQVRLLSSYGRVRVGMVPSFNVEGSHANNEIRFDNTGDVPLKIPGLGCRIDAEPNRKDRFRHGIDDFRQDRLVAREIAMLAVMDAITDKPAWHEKVFNEAIVEKWRVEALAMPLISPLAWEWCLRELREMTTFLKKYGFVTTLETCSLCAKADDLIDEGLRQELLTGVMPLLDIKDEAKDWHPNSNNQVLNLVHPSLFPLVYGRTQVLQSGRIGLQDYLSSCGKGEIAPEQTIESGHYSSRFQWLPTEVKFIGTGTDVEITSYINNLHPSHHKSLYSTISKMMGKAIPMWNEMLIKSNRGGFLSRFKVCEAVSDEKPLYLEGLSDYRTDDEWAADLAKVNAYLALPDNPAFDTSNDDEEDETFKDGTWVDDENLDLDNAVDWKFMRVRETAHPEPGADLSYEEWKSYRRPSGSEEGSSPRRDYHGVHLENEFEKQGLQIIVKLASVELSPEKPEYEGGNWHLEVGWQRQSYHRLQIAD